MSKKKFTQLTFIITLVILLAMVGYLTYKQYRLSQIDSFEECVAAGLPVQESYPAKCVVNSKTFVQNVSVPPEITSGTAEKPPISDSSILAEPVSDSLSRITKKPYGKYITPATSPIQPEKFSGYHTGTDFETTDAETNTLVPVYSITEGTVRYKGTVDGYGGVIILESTINNQKVTVLYGHIDISSNKIKIGDKVNKGDFIANLGAGYSSQTAGERKHLHLGIHVGSNIEYRGYVQNKSEISSWLNFQDIR